MQMKDIYEKPVAEAIVFTAQNAIADEPGITIPDESYTVEGGVEPW